MWGHKRRWMRAVCCVLLLAALAARAADEDAAEADDDDVDAEEEVDEECPDQPLSWLARHGLVSELEQSYPWITEPIVEASLVYCADDDPMEVQVSFEPHLYGPRWERSWTVDCQRVSTLHWSCEFPEEQMFVYLAEGEVAVPVGREVSPSDALEALAAIVVQSSEPGGIPDPFDASDPFLGLSVESVLSVEREEICAGLLVAVQLDSESPRNQFCVEHPPCARGACPWTVRVEGATE